MDVIGQHHAPIVSPPGKNPGTIEQEAGLAPEPVPKIWRTEKYLATAGIGTPNRQARSLSRYAEYTIPPTL
jgi:hypothetical protein